MRAFVDKWVVDYEFHTNRQDGNVQVPVCYVAQNVGTGQVIRHWIAGNETMPEYSTKDDSLFIAYYASAEMGCHIVMGFPRPLNILDLYAEFRCLTNGRTLPSGRGLIGALNYYGLTGGDADYKDIMRDRIIQGPPYLPEEQGQILDYCQKDVELTTKLYRYMEGIIDVDRALLRGRYMWAAAEMEYSGVPIDTHSLNILIEQWDNIKERLIERVDRDYSVYEGKVFKTQRFKEYLIRNHIPWDLTDTGLPKLDDDYMKIQAKSFPQLKPLQELRYSLGQLKLNDLRVGSDCRNRALLSAFASRTGRNQPSSSKFIFGNAVWLRNLIMPKVGMALAYVDYEQQEIAIAAALSGDPELKRAYETGDPYTAFAKAAGKIPADGGKHSHPEIREKFKVCMLALNYGMSMESFAKRSGLSLIEARDMFKTHKQTYRQYWEWLTDFVDRGLLSGRIGTRYGWQCYTTNMKYRAVENWPMQSHGADILRLAIILCLENNIKVIAPVHDAILIESPIDRIDNDVATVPIFNDRSEQKSHRIPDTNGSEDHQTPRTLYGPERDSNVEEHTGYTKRKGCDSITKSSDQFFFGFDFSWIETFFEAERPSGLDDKTLFLLAMSLHHVYKVKKTAEFELTPDVLRQFHLNRCRIRKYLVFLKEIGVIDVTFRSRASPVVTLNHKPTKYVSARKI